MNQAPSFPTLSGTSRPGVLGHTLRFFVRCGMTLILLVLPWTISIRSVQAQDLSTTAEKRFQRYLPRSYPKLVRRATVRVVIMGDSIGNYFSNSPEENARTEKSWHGLFLANLARQFFYSGGVDEVLRKNAVESLPAVRLDDEGNAAPLAPRGTLPALAETIAGSPRLAVYNLCRNGASVIHVLQCLAGEAFEYRPDLAFIMYGTNDAQWGEALDAYERTLETATAKLREQDVDVVICAPPLICGENARESLPLTRPYAIAARRVAQKLDVLFFDAGAALATVAIPKEGVGDLFENFLTTIRSRYMHDGTLDELHPNAEGHRLMAEALWQTLTEGQPESDLRPTGSLTLPSVAKREATLEITVYNPKPTPKDAAAAETSVPPAEPTAEGTESKTTDTAEPDPNLVHNVAISPLTGDRCWVPKSFDTLPLKPFSARRMTRIPCEPRGFPRQHGIISIFSAVLHDGKISRLIDIEGPVFPVALGLPSARYSNVAGDLTLEATLYNHLRETLQGTAEVEWLGKKYQLDVALEPNGQKPLRLRLGLPEEASQTSADGPLLVRISAGADTWEFQKHIHARRHLVLGQSEPLQRTSAAPATTAPTLTARADAKGLYLTFDLPSNTALRSDSLPLARVDLQFDARPQELLGTAGYGDTLTFSVPFEDGPIDVSRPRPGIFGETYDRELAPEHFRIHLKTTADGKRRLHCDIPRNYFYQHQWSLGEKGQNTLGISGYLNLTEFTSDQPQGDQSAPQSWEIFPNNLNPRDPQGFATLNLSRRSGGEWTVVVD